MSDEPKDQVTAEGHLETQRGDDQLLLGNYSKVFSSSRTSSSIERRSHELLGSNGHDLLSTSTRDRHSGDSDPRFDEVTTTKARVNTIEVVTGMGQDNQLKKDWENLLNNEWQKSQIKGHFANPDGLQESQRDAKLARLFYVSPNLIPSDQQQPHVPVYVRESYRGLCEALMERSDTNKYLITGTPGVGKSYFAFHFIRYLLIEHSHGQEVSILYQNCHVDMDYYAVLKRTQDDDVIIEHYRMVGGSKVQKVNYLTGDEHVSWYVFDGWHTFGPRPQRCDGRTIVITSPDYYRQYKEFSRNAMELYMPPWEKSEIVDLVESLGYEDDRKKEVVKVFKNWGGVIREVLSPDIKGGQKDLECAIRRSDEDTVFKFVKAYGEVPDAVSHKILHQKSVVRNGRTNYEKTWIDFASSHVMKTFMEKYMSKSTLDTAMKAVEVLYRYNNGHELAGYFFEEAVHMYIEHGCQYEARYLGKWNGSEPPVSTSSRHITPKFSKGKNKILTFKADGEFSISEEVSMKCYLRPSLPNFPVIDSFVLSKKNLVLYQITVSEHHNVAVKDLKRLLDQLRQMTPPENASLITPQNTYLVFIVPGDNFKNFKCQQPRGYEGLPQESEEVSQFKEIRQYALKFP
jgi:RHS (Retrotransposon Hot Spot) family protein